MTDTIKFRRWAPGHKSRNGFTPVGRYAHVSAPASGELGRVIVAPSGRHDTIYGGLTLRSYSSLADSVLHPSPLLKALGYSTAPARPMMRRERLEAWAYEMRRRMRNAAAALRGDWEADNPYDE